MENRELTSLGDLPVSDLMHYGVLGMKWGVRRYQNKDGSLTAAGKKRYDQLEAELSKLQAAKDVGAPTQTRREKREAEKLRKARAANLVKARQAKAEKQKEAEERAKKIEKDKLSVEEMTSEEIQAKIDRINLENRLKDLMKEPVKEVTPKKTSRGKEFTNKFKDDVVDKLAKNVAADLVSQTVKAVGVYGLNKVLNKALNADGDKPNDYVFTNNKRKDK